jgi:carbonic anhydrase/acetyltransferase-like protein (isoleucine patch superfamily)
MVTIGEDAVIAAGTVVVRDVPPRSLVVGNPGRITKWVDELTCRTGVAPQGYSYRPYAQRETLAREQDKTGPWKARPE